MKVLNEVIFEDGSFIFEKYDFPKHYKSKHYYRVVANDTEKTINSRRFMRREDAEMFFDRILRTIRDSEYLYNGMRVSTIAFSDVFKYNFERDLKH